MSIVLLCVGWYLMGVAGCVFGTLSDLIKGNNFTVGDLIGCTFGSLGGPIILIVGVVAYLTALSNTGKVLIKRKK